MGGPKESCLYASATILATRPVYELLYAIWYILVSVLPYQVNVLGLCICNREAIKLMNESGNEEGLIINMNG